MTDFEENCLVGQDDEYGYMCCLHKTPRTLDWCEENCGRYFSCDTVASASDEADGRVLTG